MHYTQIHIGQIIRKKLKSLGITPTELMRRMNLNTRNAHVMVRKKDIELPRLREIGKVLNQDFVQYMLADETKALYAENKTEAPPAVQQIPFVQSPDIELMRAENTFLKKENEYLKEIIQLMKKNG